ncbi:MAG: cyclic nucleotide-binding domain-containing protein [Candidatus Neomarinimicrobiota bacterium]
MENESDFTEELNRYPDASSIKIKSKKRDSFISFKKLPLILSNFPQDVAEKFLELGEEFNVQPDEEVIHKGEIGKDFYIICEGSVTVWREGIKLATLAKGDVFGELVVFRDHYRIASVRTESPTTLLKFNRHVMMDFFSRQEQRIFSIYTVNVLEVLRRKLVLTNQRVCELEQKLRNR